MPIFLLVLVALALGQSGEMQATAIAAAKTAIAQDIDRTLPRVPFETWLRGVVGSGQAPMQWETNDCGEQTGGPADRARDFPMCAEVQARLSGNRRLSISLVVGTWGRGVTTSAPAFWSANISGPNASEIVWIKTLADIPSAIGRTSN